MSVRSFAAIAGFAALSFLGVSPPAAAQAESWTRLFVRGSVSPCDYPTDRLLVRVG
jgi:hypothetical protein